MFSWRYFLEGNLRTLPKDAISDIGLDLERMHTLSAAYPGSVFWAYEKFSFLVK